MSEGLRWVVATGFSPVYEFDDRDEPRVIYIEPTASWCTIPWLYPISLCICVGWSAKRQSCTVSVINRLEFHPDTDDEEDE